MADQRKHLVLHIEISGFYADDLDACAAIYSEPEPPGPRERLDVVTEEWMRETVGITLVSLPGEKCMSDDFEIHAFTGRIVGAETRDVPRQEGGGTAEDGKHEFGYSTILCDAGKHELCREPACFCRCHHQEGGGG